MGGSCGKHEEIMFSFLKKWDHVVADINLNPRIYTNEMGYRSLTVWKERLKCT